jgi:LysR family transcriptional regulator, hydrogen peroxide-inducible genes activator
MNLNQLRFAQAVADAGTFTAAARRCYVTQSTLSSGIAMLEKELGQRLFVRTTRSVALTSFGRCMLPVIGKLLEAEAELRRTAEGCIDPDIKVARLGVCPLVDGRRLEQVLAPYREANRNVQVVLEQLRGISPRVALEEGLFDFQLGPNEIRGARLERSRLYEDPLVYLPSGKVSGPGASHEPVRLRDVARDTFLLVHDGCGLTIRTRQLFRAARLALEPYPGQSVSFQVLEEWAAMGVGSALLPQSKLSDPGLGRPLLLGNGQAAMLRFEAVWLPSVTASPHLELLARHLKTASARLASQPG